MSQHHRSRVVNEGAIEGLDVLELKHVSLNKCFANFLVGPSDEEFVVVIGFLCEPCGEIDGGLQVHPLPDWKEKETFGIPCTCHYLIVLHVGLVIK